VPQSKLLDFEGETARRREFLDGPPGGAGGPNGAEASTWQDQVESFIEWKRSETAIGDGWVQRMRWELLRFPRLLQRVDVSETPRTPTEVTPEAIALLRGRLPWEKATFQLHYAALRQFLAWAGNPIASRRGVWSLPSGESTHRRWLTREQLLQLYRGASGRGRILVVLEGFNGLRRVEVLRLRAKDVGLGEGCLRVLGKGRNGGKWRQVPVFPPSRQILEQAIARLGPSDRLLPLSRSGADQLLRRSAEAAGLTADGVRVSHHDLRRTFGRLAHSAGMDLIQLKNLFGHTSVEMTVHYIGLDSETMRAGLERLSQSIGPLG